MKTSIYCRVTAKGIHSFYLRCSQGDFFLFTQSYRRGVQRYFGRGVRLEEACNYARAGGDRSLLHTMDKLPMYLRYAEKEYGITVLRRTGNKQRRWSRAA